MKKSSPIPLSFSGHWRVSNTSKNTIIPAIAFSAGIQTLITIWRPPVLTESC